MNKRYLNVNSARSLYFCGALVGTNSPFSFQGGPRTEALCTIGIKGLPGGTDESIRRGRASQNETRVSFAFGFFLTLRILSPDHPSSCFSFS
jgi:hypothetical protein